MIPTIGIMIGAYIILRCLELMAANGGRFANWTGRTVVFAFAAITMLTAAVSIYVLLHAGTEPTVQFNPPPLPGLR